ncbi:MAG: two component transcriptional regulator, LuxR family [Chloroflexi bacterium]|nr:two component transcriptional regulator, LuxR family [Chloroflexota bacterium]
MIRVLVVDDHTSFRQSLAFMLQREADLTVVGQAGSLAEARHKLKGVEVAVVDIGLPNGDGLALINDVHDTNPLCRVLVVTGSSASIDVARAVIMGAEGVLHKSVDVHDIIAAVRRLGTGEDLLTRKQILTIVRFANEQGEQISNAQTRLERLTRREWDVLLALAEGLSDKDIGEKLQISRETVRSHVVRILSKLEVHSRLQALVFAVRFGGVKIS